jgi:hypothetical protein
MLQLMAAKSVVSGIKSLTGALVANKKDPERVATAQSNLTKALAGDSAALAALQSQAVGSATEVGKDAARRALAAYAATKPSFVTPINQTPLQQQVADTVNNVRTDIANGLQNIGAGATTALANTVDPNKKAVTVPLTQTQLLVIAGIAAAILFLRK